MATNDNMGNEMTDRPGQPIDAQQDALEQSEQRRAKLASGGKLAVLTAAIFSRAHTRQIAIVSTLRSKNRYWLNRPLSGHCGPHDDAPGDGKGQFH